MGKGRKSKISRAEFEHLYLDRGLTEKEIAEKFGCAVSTVQSARRRWKINCLSIVDRNSKLIKVTPQQEAILRGALLGSAVLTKDGICVLQGAAQDKPLLYWLFKTLHPYFGEIRSVKSGTRIRSCPHQIGQQLRREYYSKGIKTLSPQLLERLTPLSLTIWLLDRGRVTPNKRLLVDISNYTPGEGELLCKYLLEQWGVSCEVQATKQRILLTFSQDEAFKIGQLVRVHLPLQFRKKFRSILRFGMYLSGGMEYKSDLGSNWREWITDKLKAIDIDALDPVKLEGEGDGLALQTKLKNMKEERQLDKVRKIAREKFFRKDIFAIQLADAIIVLYDEGAQKGAGTLSESWEAFREGRPVYLLSMLPLKDIPSWLIGETTEIFFDFEELLSYLSDPYNLPKDIERAMQVSQQILGDLYFI